MRLAPSVGTQSPALGPATTNRRSSSTGFGSLLLDSVIVKASAWTPNDFGKLERAAEGFLFKGIRKPSEKDYQLQVFTDS